MCFKQETGLQNLHSNTKTMTLLLSATVDKRHAPEFYSVANGES